MQQIYGALAYRYWLGTPGSSELISGHVVFYEPILVGDQEEFESDLKVQLRSEVALRHNQRYGLQLSHSTSSGQAWASSDLDRIEWLLIWEADQDTEARVKAFVQGWSATLPPGKRARDLDIHDLEALGRMVGLPGQKTVRPQAPVDPRSLPRNMR